MPLARDESNSVFALRKWHYFSLERVSLILETNVVQTLIVDEAKEVHILIVNLERADLIRVRDTLNHYTAQANVWNEARIVQVNILCPDLGCFHSYLVDIIIFFGFIDARVDIFIRARPADREDVKLLVCILFFVKLHPAVLDETALRACEANDRHLDLFIAFILVEFKLLGGHRVIWLSLDDENLCPGSNMWIHVELKVCITSSVHNTKRLFLVPVEHINFMLVALESFYNQR